MPQSHYSREPREAWSWRRCILLGVLIGALLLTGRPATAISRIILEVGEITTPAGNAGGVIATLDLRGRGAPSAEVRSMQVDLPQPIGPLRSVHLQCGYVVVREPVFDCREGRIAANGGPTGRIEGLLSVSFHSTRGAVHAEGSGFPLAGGHAEFVSDVDKTGWSLDATGESLNLTQLRALAAPWFTVPDTLSFDGHVDVEAQAMSRNGVLAFNALARTADFNLTNPEGSLVAENMVTSLRVAAERSSSGFDVEARIDGTAGQALAGLVLLDFAANPLRLESRGRFEGKTLTLEDISLFQGNLSEVHGQAVVQLGDTPSIATARLDIASLLFPAAYTSFLQIGLAATDFGKLTTTGLVSGSIDVADNRITRAEVQISDLAMTDAEGTFAMADVHGHLHWAADEQAEVNASWLSWSSASAYGLTGGASRLDFLMRGLGFELTRPARLPIFDGAMVVNRLSTRRLGGAEAELDFDAQIEPISMPLLSRAFGWPEMSGQLSGRIPGLHFSNNVLSIQGDLVASVFDGTIVGRDIRLQDPFGPWPRFYADVTARRLDLSLVTRTFPIGSITGRLDADIRALELFNWSPVAFDARLYSTPGDRSRRVISQKAITSISNVGGGGGGVAAALQSGVLRFFDDFRYDAIGITCRLQNEVCLMGGIEPAGIGYYLVRGRGLPRIDIIGNQGRVAWPQLVAQIVTAMRSNAVIR